MAARDPLQPLFLLSDEPIDSHEDDFLNRGNEARAIAGAVLGTTGPLTIGVLVGCARVELFAGRT